MTTDEIRLWAMDGSGGATPLPSAAQTESEKLLENTIVKHPEMLMPGLTLVGRQTPTEGGPLDLLGVDADGRLVVFELKRGTLSRDAVAQVIDYASYLDAMPEQELANYISERSGSHGIERIEDFEEWHDSKSQGQGLSALKPVRMVLVGLGVDERTTRMVRFLATSGIYVSLLTFHGYSYDGKALLARQVQVQADPESDVPHPPKQSQNELRKQLDNRIQGRMEQWPEGQKLWDSLLEMFHENFHTPLEYIHDTPAGWARYRLNFRLQKQGSRRTRYAAIDVPARDNELKVIFFPNAVNLCLDKFTQLRREMPFKTYPDNSPSREEGVIEIQFLLKSISEWETYKERLSAVTRSVYTAYAEEDE